MSDFDCPFLPEPFREEERDIVPRPLPCVPVGPQGSIATFACCPSQKADYKPSDWYCCRKPGVERLRKCREPCSESSGERLTRPITISDEVLSTDATVDKHYARRGRRYSFTHPLTTSNTSKEDVKTDASYMNSSLSRPITRSSMCSGSSTSFDNSGTIISSLSLSSSSSKSSTLSRDITRSSQVLSSSFSDQTK